MRQIGVKNVKLSEYEMSIAAHLVDPLSMQVMSHVYKPKGLDRINSQNDVRLLMCECR